MPRPLLLLLASSLACVHAGLEGGTHGDDPPAAAGDAAAPEGTRERTERAEAEASPAAPPESRGDADPHASRGEPTNAPADALGPPEEAAEENARARLVRAARKHVGRRFAGDCSAFVRRVLAEADVALPELKAARTMTESLYRSMWPVARPRPGDLAYFRETRRDRGGRDRHGLTHVAMVEEVDGARVTMIHRTSRGIRRLSMNLDHPHDPVENGVLRRRSAGDRRRLPSLSGELFAGYATPLRRVEQPAAIARIDVHARERSGPQSREIQPLTGRKLRAAMSTATT